MSPTSGRAARCCTRDQWRIRLRRESHASCAFTAIATSGTCCGTSRGPVFVDLDDCLTGPAIQDLWMLLSGSPEEQQRQWQELLEGYQQFADFDFRELLLIEPLRAPAYDAPCGLDRSALERSCLSARLPMVRRARYWEAHIGDLLEQLAAIDAPPLLCS